VRTATHSLLYDAGPRYSVEIDAGHRVLVPLLRAFDEKLATVLLSHRDSDHTGGAPAVLAMQPQAELLSSIEAAHPLQKLRAARRCVAGQRWTWDVGRRGLRDPASGRGRLRRLHQAQRRLLRAAHRQRPCRGAPGRRHRAAAGSGPGRAHARAACRSSARAAPRQQDFVERCAARCGAAAHRAGPGRVPQPIRASGRGSGRALSRARDRHRGLRALRCRHGQPAELQCQRRTAKRYWHHVVP
jgi:competence protein ComEC